MDVFIWNKPIPPFSQKCENTPPLHKAGKGLVAFSCSLQKIVLFAIVMLARRVKTLLARGVPVIVMLSGA